MSQQKSKQKIKPRKILARLELYDKFNICFIHVIIER